MIVAAIDSAELSGVAVVARDPLLGTERLLFHDVTTIRAAGDVAEAVAAIALWRPDVVAVEEPFAHPRNPITGMTLARLLGRWLQELEERARLGVVTIPPSLWQPAVLPGFSSRMPSAARKAAAISLARERFGVDATADEADAIAIGLYVARNVKLGRAA